MATKRKLSDLIGEETQQAKSSANQSVTAEISDSKSAKVTKLQTDKVPNSGTDKVTELPTTKVSDSKTVELPNQQTLVVPNSEATAVPKYLTLVRKESRLRDDQLDSLTSLTRSLNRKRKGSGERITENTLIRIAVDLLITHCDQLKGTTEEELTASVGLD